MAPKQLVHHGGVFLPDAAWRTLVAAHGVEILKEAGYIPEGIAVEVLDSLKTVPYDVAVRIAEVCPHEPVVRRLVRDKRSSVLAAVLKNWSLDAAAIDEIVAQRPHAGIEDRLYETPMELRQRLRLWSYSENETLLEDALRYLNELPLEVARTVSSIEIPSWSWSSVEEYLTQLLYAFPELFEHYLSMGTRAHLSAAAASRTGAAHAGRILGLTNLDSRQAEGLCVSLADNPATPVDLRRKALSMLEDLGSTVHLELAIFPDVLPHIATPNDWDDHTAKVAVSRGLNDFWRSSAGPRLWTLVEIIDAPNVSLSVRRAAAFRFQERAQSDKWMLVHDRIGDVVTDLLSGYHASRWESYLQERADGLRRRPALNAAASCVHHNEQYLASKSPLIEMSDSIPTFNYSGLEARAVAAYLNEQFGSDEGAWALAWELLDGYYGTFSDLVELVTVTRN